MNLLVIENVFLHILIQEALSNDTDMPFPYFTVGVDIKSVLMILYSLERVLLAVVSLYISSVSVDVSILPCFKLILSVMTDLSCRYCNKNLWSSLSSEIQ